MSEAKKPAAKKPEAEKKAKGHYVAKGCAITATGKRVLDEGVAVEEKDLSGGKEAFAALVNSGHIVKEG